MTEVAELDADSLGRAVRLHPDDLRGDAELAVVGGVHQDELAAFTERHAACLRYERAAFLEAGKRFA